MDLKFRNIYWQCFPAFCASQIAVLFGLMVGWPSPAYPYLLSEASPIPISMDQSAMIAGFLMAGASIASPLSSKNVCGTKYGVIFSLLLNLIGWITIYFGTTIYNLLLGRLLVGLGFGYGQGQVKKYVKQLCDPDIVEIKMKLLNLYLGLGILITYIIGSFVNYDTMALIFTITSAIILVINLFLPHTPKEYIQFNKAQYAAKVLRGTKGVLNVRSEINHLKTFTIIKQPGPTFCSILRQKSSRNKFFIVAILTFLQQFTGIPATIVYCKIIFVEFQLSRPEMYTICYALLFLGCNFISLFYFDHLNKKLMLIISVFSISLVLGAMIIVLLFEYHSSYNLIPVILLYLFQFCHTLGLSSIPMHLIHDFFDEKSRKVVSNYQLIVFCISALLITKIFQVLYENYSIVVPFCLFFGVSVLNLSFTAVFVPYNIVPAHDGV